jgi:HD-GYP domain-containing protein (c-di-GMP phosphodiesterase class II)
LSLKIAKHIPEITDHDLEVLEAAALLHDIGMIGLPNEILLKSRIEMTGEERELFLSHPVRGELILKEVEFLQPISKLIRAHHEQFNGKGFPDSIPGEEIPLLAKIISAASVYDNLLNRGKVPLSKIPESMERLRGYQLDPVMVDHILRINLEKIQEEKGRAFIEIDVCDLKEGMTLASDVRMRKGALVMPADTKLTGHDIEKLLSYWKLDCINDQIRIYKSTGIH